MENRNASSGYLWFCGTLQRAGDYQPSIQSCSYFEANDIDIVLTGHDHAYSRSKLLKGGQSTYEYTDDEFDEMLDRDMDAGEDPETRFEAPGNIQNDTSDPAEQKYLEYLYSVMDDDAVESLTDGQDAAVNPEGIMYLTAGSSSGSKYYDLVPRQQTYIASRWQQDVPTYSVIDVTETSLTLNTYRTDTDEKIDSQFMIVKSADHSQLSKLIEEAEALKSDDYTADSFSALQQALEAAKNVNDNAQATEDELSNAYTALKSAMDALVEVTVQVPSDENPDGNADDPSQNENGSAVTDTSAAGVNEKPSTVKPVKTGDYTNVVLPAAVLVLAAAAGGTTIYIRRKRS